MVLGSSADSPYAFSTFHHLKRFRMKTGKKLLRSLSEYAEKKISIQGICGWVVVEIARDSWNFIGGSSPPSRSFHVCYLRGPSQDNERSIQIRHYVPDVFLYLFWQGRILKLRYLKVYISWMFPNTWSRIYSNISKCLMDKDACIRILALKELYEVNRKDSLGLGRFPRHAFRPWYTG